MSLAFAALGIAGLIYVKDKRKPVFISAVILFYVLMELLQTVQAYIVNDCTNPINISLTEIAYIFVISQPLLWNSFFYLNSLPSEQPLFKVGIALAIGWMIFNILGRILYGTGRPLTETDTVYASDKVCTMKGSSHLYWKWTSANLGDFNATFIMHLLIWFIPALLSVSHLTTAVILILGALASAGITYYMGDMRGFTAAWCYVSIPLVFLIMSRSVIKD